MMDAVYNRFIYMQISRQQVAHLCNSYTRLGQIAQVSVYRAINGS